MADEKPKKDDGAAPAEGGEDKKKGGNLILVLGIIVGIVVLQTALVYFIVPKPGGDKAADAVADSLKLAAEAATRMGAVTSDAPIEAIVNIAGTDGERFLKAAILLEYNEKNTVLGTELRTRVPKFTDLFMDYLANLTMKELEEPGARDKIRKDMLRLINNTIPAKLGEVDGVVLKTFIIQ